MRVSVLLLCVFALAGCRDERGVTDGSGTTDANSRSAQNALTVLIVKGRSPLTGYSRSQFGAAWDDDNDEQFGHNGCDTRNDILRRDLTSVILQAGTRDCVVSAGVLLDPYSAKTIQFRRGATTSEDVEIDHVVALADAWQTGAQQLTSRDRQNLANDPLNLLAVDGPTNQAKGSSDAASWLPANKPYRCAYIARQIAVKVKYHLSVTRAEHDAMADVLRGCPSQQLP